MTRGSRLLLSFQLSLNKYTVMKLLLSIASICMFLQVAAAGKDSVVYYNLPDSVKAVSFIADINIKSTAKKEVFAGISSQYVSLVLELDKKEKEVSFEFPKNAIVVSTGINVDRSKGELEWKYNWQLNTTYKLLIASAADSAENFVLYSGYIFLPGQQQWKLIGTCRVNGEREGIKAPGTLASTGDRSNVQAVFSNAWCQGSAGSWKRLDDEGQPGSRPVINPLPNVDSVEQYQLDKARIMQAISSGTTDVYKDTAGVYYKIIDPGSGKSFTVEDSITVHYQLRIFRTAEVISGSPTESYTFPLKGLIKAWQIAVPLIRTGGKIKLVIPSALGYSIRTRAPKIPPNSILEFEVEVMNAKSAVK
jgi:FKBP-type peptidyl-prolyl cis-trans isomerase FkpA